MKCCFLYPGQGSQYPGMGKDLWEESSSVKELFKTASFETGLDTEKLLFEGTEESLKQTRNTQIAITLNNLSSALLLKESGLDSAGCAGFSLGEYTALWDAGVLDLPSLFKVIDKRGALLEEAGGELASKGGAPPGMAAVLGLDYDTVTSVLETNFSGKDLYIANHSSPIQIVVAGTASCLKEAEKIFEEAGAMRYVVLNVSGPFHSPLLAKAGEKFASFLDGVDFRPFKKPFYSNVTGKCVSDSEDLKALCVRQISNPVRWCDVEQSILDDGYDTILETGPGVVLSGLWKSFYKKLKCRPAGKFEQIQKIKSELL